MVPATQTCVGAPYPVVDTGGGVRGLGPDALPTDRPISGNEIRELRERAHMSQGVFARHLHTSPGYISKLERGEAAASGPALALLNVIKRKGTEVLL